MPLATKTVIAALSPQQDSLQQLLPVHSTLRQSDATRYHSSISEREKPFHRSAISVRIQSWSCLSRSVSTNLRRASTP